MYNPEASRLMIVVFFCMLAAIVGGMMLMPNDGDADNSPAISRIIKAHAQKAESVKLQKFASAWQ